MTLSFFIGVDRFEAGGQRYQRNGQSERSSARLWAHKGRLRSHHTDHCPSLCHSVPLTSPVSAGTLHAAGPRGVPGVDAAPTPAPAARKQQQQYHNSGSHLI